MADRVELQATPRLQLAHVAAAATLACGGVVALDPREATRGGGDVVHGVDVIATGEAGRYSVDLFVQAELGDLRVLGEALRAAVREAATAAGLAAALGPVGVTITDVRA